VDAVANSVNELHKDLDPSQYDTATRGTRHVAGARPAGAGVYAIIEHHLHTHLAYVLELPKEVGDVQSAFNIVKEGSYILTVKNPKRAKQGVGLGPKQAAKLPDHLQKVLQVYSFVPAKPMEFLDHEGVEVVLVGTSGDLRKEFGEVGQSLEDLGMKHARFLPDNDKLYRELEKDRAAHPPEPLLTGDFK